MATSKKVTQVNAQEKEDKNHIPDKTKREQWIKESAYFIAESRGFMPGSETEDWHTAVVAYQQYAS